MSALAEVDEEFDQTQFNLEVWEDVLADPFLASLPYHFETNKFGRLIMSPPSGAEHSYYQGELAFLLRSHFDSGRVLGAAPISTSQGIRETDAGWISTDRGEQSVKKNVFTIAPELCIEILSPSNSKGEMAEKMKLYFEAGAEEVWIITKSGEVEFYHKSADERSSKSKLCPAFPKKVNLP